MKWPRCSYRQFIVNAILTVTFLWLVSAWLSIFANYYVPKLQIDLNHSGHILHD